MKEKMFSSLKEEYRFLDRELMRKGKLPMRSTQKGFWSPAIMDELFEGFNKMRLQKYHSFIDLGSGDGRVANVASLFVPKSVGVEIDEHLHHAALRVKDRFNLENTNFHHQDFFHHDLSSYHVVFLNPDTALHRGLEQKLLKELKGVLIVYGHHFHPKHLRKEHSTLVGNTPLTVYTNHKRIP